MVENIDEVLQHSEIIVIGNKAREFEGILHRLRTGQHLVDFVRITNHWSNNGDYSGISW
jgi:GDP-mannose 6-dehydrogenase